MKRLGLCVPKKAYFGQNLAVFGPKFLIFTGESKIFCTHITQKPARHLLRIIFGRAWDQMDQKGQYSAQNDQECIIWAKFGHFCTKYLNFNGRKQKFGTHITEKSPSHLVRIVFWSVKESSGPKMPIFGQKCQCFAKMPNLSVFGPKSSPTPL